jgi:hypothetical protein
MGFPSPDFQTMDKLTLRSVPLLDFWTTVFGTVTGDEFHPLNNKKLINSQENYPSIQSIPDWIGWMGWRLYEKFLQVYREKPGSFLHTAATISVAG